jgi:anti-anti-sigma regulatory factor
MQVLLDEQLTTEAAERLRRLLLDGLARKPGLLRLDGQQVLSVEVPCLQVLLAAAHQAVTQGCLIELYRPSPVLKEALRLLGIESLLSVQTDARDEAS